MNRNNTEVDYTNLHEICEAISSLKEAAQVEEFLADLLTKSELEDVIKRWSIFKMLNNNEPQRSIAKKLSVSLCKITRGAKILKNNNSIVKKTISK